MQCNIRGLPNFSHTKLERICVKVPILIYIWKKTADDGYGRFDIFTV